MHSFSLALASISLTLASAACQKSIDVDVGDGDDASTGKSLPLCPDGVGPGQHGPVMLAVGRLDGTCGWIDTTEVTRAHYRSFLDAVSEEDADTSNVDTCKGINPEFAPAGGLDASVSDHPVAGVDWCDAAAFCAWAGKQLCGTYDLQGASTSIFQTVCTHGTDGTFRADEQFAISAGNCNGNASSTVPVATLAECLTPTDIADLVGNVKEWTQECEGTSATANCAYRGGSYRSKPGSLDGWGCEGKVAAPRNHAAPDLGFRCCAEDPAAQPPR